MSFRLVPLTKGTAPIITIQRPVLLIGRHIECDVRIEQTKISRRHCCVAMAYDRVVVRDLGSRNKIRVNGEVVEEARLRAGDELAIGPLIYRLEQVDEGPEASSTPRPATKVASPAPPAVAPPPPVPAAAKEPQWALEDSDEDLIPLVDL
jgi:pSer/pThr/pTyr-binding forkhead associated (FHA) protein